MKFKHTIESGNYLNLSLSRSQRSLLAQVRLDKVMRKAIFIESRSCALCNTDDSKDELHFICYC